MGAVVPGAGWLPTFGRAEFVRGRSCSIKETAAARNAEQDRSEQPGEECFRLKRV